MISNYLNQTVTRNKRTGNDVYGKPIVGENESVKARFQEKQRRAMDEKGQVFLTDAEMWIMPDQELELDDVIQYEGIKYKTARIEIKRGITGNKDHKKVLLVKTKENG